MALCELSHKLKRMTVIKPTQLTANAQNRIYQRIVNSNASSAVEDMSWRGASNSETSVTLRGRTSLENKICVKTV